MCKTWGRIQIGNKTMLIHNTDSNNSCPGPISISIEQYLLKKNIVIRNSFFIKSGNIKNNCNIVDNYITENYFYVQNSFCTKTSSSTMFVLKLSAKSLKQQYQEVLLQQDQHYHKKGKLYQQTAIVRKLTQTAACVTKRSKRNHSRYKGSNNSRYEGVVKKESNSCSMHLNQ